MCDLVGWLYWADGLIDWIGWIESPTNFIFQRANEISNVGHREYHQLQQEKGDQLEDYKYWG